MAPFNPTLEFYVRHWKPQVHDGCRRTRPLRPTCVDLLFSPPPSPHPWRSLSLFGPSPFSAPHPFRPLSLFGPSPFSAPHPSPLPQGLPQVVDENFGVFLLLAIGVVTFVFTFTVGSYLDRLFDGKVSSSSARSSPPTPVRTLAYVPPPI